MRPVVEEVQENTFTAAVLSYCQGKTLIYFSRFLKEFYSASNCKDFHWLTIASVFAISSLET